MPCITVDISHYTGDINIVNSKFMFNTVSDLSLCEGMGYGSLMIYQPKSTANILIKILCFTPMAM